MLESSMPLISRAVDPNQLREPLQPGGLLPHQFVRLSERSIAHCSCPAEAEAEALWRVRISGITRASERVGSGRWCICSWSAAGVGRGIVGARPRPRCAWSASVIGQRAGRRAPRPPPPPADKWKYRVWRRAAASPGKTTAWPTT